jgi:outer membrane receptor protein involved in Fe transport
LVRGTHSENDVFFAGRFTFGDLPGSLLLPALPPSFTINALQAFNLGLAQTYLQGWGNPTVASTGPYSGIYVQDSWKLLPSLKLDLGLRYELDVRKQPVPTVKTNFAPRIGFAWSLPSGKTTVLRGGYGIFYSPIYYQIDWAANALNDIDGRRHRDQRPRIISSQRFATRASSAFPFPNER